MNVKLTQFIRPNGRKEEVWCDDLPDDLAPKVQSMENKGLRFTAEVIGSKVSLCIENDEEDLACEFADNGSGENSPHAVLERMIRKFDLVEKAK
jgi:hypothetical protein